MKETKEYLTSIGMPSGDLYDLPTLRNVLRMVDSIVLKCLVSKDQVQ